MSQIDRFFISFAKIVSIKMTDNLSDLHDDAEARGFVGQAKAKQLTFEQRKAIISFLLDKSSLDECESRCQSFWNVK